MKLKINKIYSLLFLLCGFSFSNTIAALQGTKTIGGASPDYATFTAAVADMVAQGLSGPIVFNVRNGSYKERIIIPNIPTVSLVNTITFQSESGDSTAVLLWDSAVDAATNYVVRYNAASFVNFKNLSFESKHYQYKRIIDLTNKSCSNTFKSCVFKAPFMTSKFAGATADRIYSTFSADNTRDTFITISNNIFINGRNAVFFDGTIGNNDGIKVDKNIFINQYYNAIYLKGVGGKLDNRITNNSFIMDTISDPSNSAVWLSYCLNKMHVSNNLFRLKSGYGFYGTTLEAIIVGTADIIISNNLMLIGDSTTAPATGIWLDGSTNNTRILNNTVVTKTTDATPLYNAPLYLDGVKNPYIYNNNLVALGEGPAAAYVNSNLTLWTNVNNNNYIVSPTAYALIDTNVAFSDLSDWQATGLDTNSVSTDPMFFSPTDYWPCSYGLIGAGLSVSEVTMDILGKSRVTNPTIGAYEVKDIRFTLNDTAICSGDALNVSSDIVGADTYLWTDVNSGNTDTTSGPYSAAAGGLFILNLTNACGVLSDSMLVLANPLPQINITDTTICDTSSIILSLSGIVSANWSPGYGLDDTTSLNPIANPDITTTYTVEVIDSMGCVNSKDIIITVDTCLPEGGGSTDIEYAIADGLFNIYPNPSDGFVYISIPENTITEILIGDLTGKVLLRQAVSHEQNNILLNLNLPSGVYLLQLKGITELATKKITIL